MKIYTFIIICLLVSGCAAKYDKRLIGTWQSNPDRTMQEFIKREPSRATISPERMKKISDIFGHMVHSYTKDTLITTYKGEKFTARYEVIEIGENYTVIKAFFSNDIEDYKVRFEEDLNSFWVNEETSFPENFIKIK